MALCHKFANATAANAALSAWYSTRGPTETVRLPSGATESRPRKVYSPVVEWSDGDFGFWRKPNGRATGLPNIATAVDELVTNVVAIGGVPV